MPSSATPSLRLEKQFTGENINVWGEHLNTNFELIDQAISGLRTIALTGDHTLTAANWTEDQARYAMLKFTGSAAPTVTIPSVAKAYRIWNACSGALILTTGAGTAVSVDPGDIVDVLCDGTNVRAPGFGDLSLKDYIASVVVGGGATLPSLFGAAGKWLTNNGAAAIWGQPAVADISDYATDQAAKRAEILAKALATTVALAISF
ncbi:MAG: hypothetical protein ACK4YQ_08280 [Phenylobacterium sp.]|uniref:hypothetical protein n=1 Tax=Phenylobacterium sp. TaxID=1871053 RepID=UPI00391ABD45